MMKHTPLLHLLCAVLSCLPFPSWGIHFKTLTMNDGLPSNTVKSIAQDDAGFVWFGTFNGLCRYDGLQLTTYLPQPDDSLSLSGGQVQALLYTSEGLWAGTQQGLDLYAMATDNFRHARTQEGQALGNITQLTVVCGHLYALSNDQRLYRRQTGTTFTRVRLPGDTGCRAIANYKDRYLLVATSDSLFVMDAEKHQVLSQCPLTGVPHEAGDYILYYSKATQTIYLGFGIGYDSRTFRLGPDLQPEPCEGPVPSHLKAVADHGDDVLFATDCTGLYRLHDGQMETYTPQNCNISSDAIHSLFTDRQGSVWMGTYRRGVNLLSYRYNILHTLTFNERQLPHPVVTSLIRHDGFLYAGTDGGGLAVHSFAEGSYRTLTADNSPLPGNNILTMAEDHDGFWMAAYGEGLCYYSYSQQAITRTLRITDRQGHPFRFIWQLAADSHGDLWVIGDRVCIIHPETGQAETLEHFDRQFCNSICIAGERVWIATDDGLYRLHADTRQIEGRFTGFLQGESPKEVYEDLQGEVWVAVSFRLLRITADGQLTATYELPARPANNKITSITDDRLGHLWVGTENGLFRFDRRTASFVRMDEENRNDFSQFCRHSTYSDGQRLYFGSTDGLVWFRPDEATATAPANPVCFDHICLERSRQQFPLGRTDAASVTLAHDDNFFTLHFSIPDLLTARKTNIVYKLEHFDRQWNSSGPTRQVSYTNVPPGTYTFLIAATDEAGNVNPCPSRLTLRVKHPWWNTPGMRLVWAALATAILLGTVRAYIERGRRKVIAHQRELEEQARRRLQEEKMDFYSGITHELRTPLFLIGAPLEELLQHQGATLRVPYALVERMRQNVNRLNSLVNRITAFRKLDERQLKAHIGSGDIVECLQTLVEEFRLSSQKDITFVFNSPSVNWKVDFDREKVELIVSNLLSNSYKYTPAGGSVSVSLAQEQDRLLIDVSDTGIGIAREQIDRIFQKYYRTDPDSPIQGDGIGLSFVKELVEIVGGSITADSQPGKGTTFHLSLPLSGLQPKTDDQPTEATVPPPALPGNETASSVAVPTPSLLQVLLIDDEPQTLDLLEQALAGTYQVLRASTAEEGLRLAVRHTPDLILTDLLMPHMDGCQLITALKSHEELCGVPILLFSAKETEDDKIRAFQAGADAYITKPVSLRYIKARIDTLLAQKERQKEQGLDQWARQRDAHYSTQDRIFITRLRDIIDRQLSEGTPVNVESLAAEMNMSYSALYKKVKLITDRTVLDFLNDYRIFKAVQCFKEGERNIAEVAEKCGFPDIRAFRNAFKARMNTTPKQFLQEL